MADQAEMQAMRDQFIEALRRINNLEQQAQWHNLDAAEAAAHAARVEQELVLERAMATARDRTAQDVLTVVQDAVTRPSGAGSSSGLGKGFGTPERFAGADEAWTDWAFVVKGYIGSQ